MKERIMYAASALTVEKDLVFVGRGWGGGGGDRNLKTEGQIKLGWLSGLPTPDWEISGYLRGETWGGWDLWTGETSIMP